ncbi:HD domain-containing protein [Candidatus Microgenomates bacterium]|nr:HD domain-containing protein [Candidatus Microgenomates bacterium]
MIINDRVYGKIEIENKLIAELVGSSPVQRLKHINQSGGPVFLEPSRDITRFEHSIGVYFILKKYGASLEEQVAGLLHDIPHTAFSHVIDFVFPSDDHTFHEQFEEKIILNSEIPAILNKYGLKVQNVLAKENFPLLEAELPDLSADRIDYFLRDTRPDQIFPDSLVKDFLDGIFVKDSVFYFKDKSLASLYSILFLNAGRILWIDPNSHGSFYLLATALKRAMEIGKITLDDFFGTDREVFKKLKEINDEQVKKYVSRLNPSTRFVYVESSLAEFSGPNKPRVVDPLVETPKGLVRISKIVPRLNELFNHYKKSYKILHVSEDK